MTRYEDLAATLFALTGQRGDGIFVHRAFVQFTGALEAGLLLSQLLYWTPRAQVQLPETDGTVSVGWIAKTDTDFKDELCLTQYALRQARKRLERLGILETRVAKFAGVPTVHYRLIREILIDTWVGWCHQNDFAKSQSPSCDATKSYTETTTEMTTPPQQPAPAAKPAARGGGGVQTGSDAAPLPPDVLRSLHAISYHGHPQALREVTRVFAARPDYVRKWLEELQAHLADYANPAGYFRQAVLREAAPLPSQNHPPACTRCDGSGFIIEGDCAARCPACRSP